MPLEEYFVSSGDSDYIGGQVFSRAHRDVTGGTFAVALSVSDDDATDSGAWLSAVVTDVTEVWDVNVGVLLTAFALPPAVYYVWVKYGNGITTSVRRVGRVQLV